MIPNQIFSANGLNFFISFLVMEMCNDAVLCSCEPVEFQNLPGYKLTSPVMVTVPCTGAACSLMGCLKRCMTGPCEATSYHAASRTCLLHKTGAPHISFERSLQWESAHILTDFVRDGDWILVYRVTPGINKPAYDEWVTSGRHDDSPAIRPDVPIGCTSVNGSNSCDRHFRSKLLDTWDSSSIQRVKVSLYKNGIEMKYLLFNGVGKSKTSWFSANSLLTSSWTDLGDFNYFSIAGDASVNRRWFINTVYDMCETDAGWFMIRDPPGSSANCAYEGAGAYGHPKIIYGKSGKVVWNSLEFGEADVMAVYVKIST